MVADGCRLFPGSQILLPQNCDSIAGTPASVPGEQSGPCPCQGALEQHTPAPAPATMAGGGTDEASAGPTSSVPPQSTLEVSALELCFAFHLLTLKLLQNYSQSKAGTTRDIDMHQSATFLY